MKRLTAFALVLILLLSLAACGSSESGPALQDKLGTTSAVSTDPSEAEEPTEPEPESQPGSVSNKQPSGVSKNNESSEPTEGAPDCEDYKRFEGIYKAPSEDWQTVVLEVSAYSNLLLLEYGAWEDGSLVYSWAEEFWPDPDILEDGDLDNVSGYYQGFSFPTGRPTIGAQPRPAPSF